jgi:transcriptional regulator with XRE-family HTH domain
MTRADASKGGSAKTPAKMAALAAARAKRDIAAPRVAPDGWRSPEHLLDDTREYVGRFPGLHIELARYLAVSSKSVQRWLRREKMPLQATLDAIAQWRRVKKAGL